MEKRYKPIGKESEKFVSAIVERHSDIIEKLNDPVFLGMMVSQLLEERENTNRLIKNLMNKIERLETVIKEKPVTRKIEETEDRLNAKVISAKVKRKKTGNCKRC